MRTLLFILALIFCAHQSIAQLSKTSAPIVKSIYTIKGDYYSQYRNYVLAINSYSKAVKLNPKEGPAMLGMADAYHALGQDNLARQWYSKAFAIYPDVGAEHILKYIAILGTSGNSAELRHWVTLYNSAVRKSGEPIDSVIFVVENLTTLNSKGSDAAPLLYDNKMIFSSDRAAAGNFSSYKSTLSSDGIFGEVSIFHNEVNSGRTEGGLAIAANAATLFFTSTEKKKATSPPTMEIFFTTIPVELSDQLKVNRLTFKNFEFSMGHPTVNSNGTMMYFAAHNPKHTHGFDLYHSQYSGKKWSAPVALGTSVNSNGDELYPVLVNDSILYFASNGHGGLGGFDIFKMNLRNTSHSQPEHLPEPVNSTADEFGFVLSSTGSEAYLSSNRPGGLGGNDLYRIYILPFRKKKRDAAPKQEQLFIYTSKGDEIKLSGSNKENLKFDFQPGQKYNLIVEYDNFLTGTTQTVKNAATLTKMNVYTFDIQKSTELVYDQKNKIKPVQDIHINPGDLVTFQLIPNLIQDPDAEVSKVQFQKSEARVGDGQSIVFSYIAEGGAAFTEGGMSQVADLSKLDTISSIQTLAVKTPPVKSSQVPPTSSVPLQANSTPAASKKINGQDSTKTQIANVVASATIKKPTEANVQGLSSQSNNAQLQANTTPTSNITGRPDSIKTQEPNIVASVAAEKNTVTSTGANEITPSVTKQVLSPGNTVEATPTVPLDPNPANTTADIEYRVQIAASKSKLSDDQLKKIYIGSNEIHSFSEDGYYKYYIKQTPNYQAAKRAMNESGVGQAFIAAYQGEKKLKLPEAIALQKIAAKTASPTINESIVTNSSTESSNVTISLPNNSSEVLKEKTPTIEGDKGKQAASILASERVPNEALSTGITAQNAISNSKEGITNNTDHATLINQEKQVEIVIPSSQKPSDNLTSSEVMAQGNTEVKRSSLASRGEFLYRIQIAASEVPLSDASLKKIYHGDNKVQVFKDKGMYKYYILETPNYFQARQTLNEININQAFVSAYKKDVRVPLGEAINSQYKVPEKPDNLNAMDSVIKIATVNFEFDKFVLRPDQLERLHNNVTRELKRNPSYHAIVNGYTDTRGSETYNFGLSQERALFVENQIEGEGIDAKRVITQYFGESQLAKYCPKNETCDESIHQANRRVEILLIVNKKDPSIK